MFYYLKETKINAPFRNSPKMILLSNKRQGFRIVGLSL